MGQSCLPDTDGCRSQERQKGRKTVRSEPSSVLSKIEGAEALEVGRRVGVL